MMKYYPINLNIRNKRCVVIGGGEVAERKVGQLIKAGAQVIVISPRLTKKLRNLTIKEKIQHINRNYKAGDLRGAILAFAATDDHNVNRQALEEARRRRVLLNIVDSPEGCDFIVPSLVARGDLLLTVSTSGKSPALSKKIRKELKALYGREYSVFLKLLGSIRESLLTNPFLRRRRGNTFRRLVNSRLLSMIKQANSRGVDKILKDILG